MLVPLSLGGARGGSIPLVRRKDGGVNVPQIAWKFYIGGYQPAQKW